MRRILFLLTFIVVFVACKTENPGILQPEQISVRQELIKSLTNDEEVTVKDYYRKNDVEYYVTFDRGGKHLIAFKTLNDNTLAGFITDAAVSFDWTDEGEIKSDDLNAIDFWVYHIPETSLEQVDLYETAHKYAARQAKDKVKKVAISRIKFWSYPAHPVYNVEVIYDYGTRKTNYMLTFNSGLSGK